MLKYRVVEYVKGDESWYFIEYKRFFRWRKFITKYDNIDKAKHTVRELIKYQLPTVKKVVYWG